MKQIDLFEAGTGGYHTYRIPGLLATPGGSLLAWCEGRKNGHLDWVDIDLIVRRSDDGGRTWSPPVCLVDAADLPVHNVVMISDTTKGLVHLLYCINYSRCLYRRSADDGRTFSKATDISHVFARFSEAYDWNVIGTGPGHSICLANGRLIVPVWLSTGGRAHRPSRISVIYSDDGGNTWERGEFIPDTARNMSESVAVQLSEGSVLLNIRNESKERRRAVSMSADGATGWSSPVFDENLPEPICMAGMLRLPKTFGNKDRILFSNPDNLSSGERRSARGGAERINLTIKLSYDGCKSWPVSRVIESGISGYSDLAAGADGLIHLLYERGGAEGNMYVTRSLTLASFAPEWIESPQPGDIL